MLRRGHGHTVSDLPASLLRVVTPNMLLMMFGILPYHAADAFLARKRIPEAQASLESGMRTALAAGDAAAAMRLRSRMAEMPAPDPTELARQDRETGSAQASTATTRTAPSCETVGSTANNERVAAEPQSLGALEGVSQSSPTSQGNQAKMAGPEGSEGRAAAAGSVKLPRAGQAAMSPPDTVAHPSAQISVRPHAAPLAALQPTLTPSAAATPPTAAAVSGTAVARAGSSAAAKRTGQKFPRFRRLLSMAGAADDLYDRVLALPDPDCSVVRRFCMMRCREEAVSFVRAVTAAGAARLFDGRLGEVGAVALSGAGPCAVARCAVGMATRDASVSWSSLGTLVGEANNMVNANRLPDAMRVVGRVLRAVPDMAQAYAARGTAHAIANDLAKAERDFQRASRFSPRSADFCKRLGQVQVAMGRSTEGSNAYEEADRLASKEAAARLRSAKLIERSLQGEIREAELRAMLQAGEDEDDAEEGRDADGGALARGDDPCGGGGVVGRSSRSSLFAVGSVDVARERAVVLSQAGDFLAARALLEDALAFTRVPVLLLPEGVDGAAIANGAAAQEVVGVSALPYSPRAAMLPARLLGWRSPLGPEAENASGAARRPVATVRWLAAQLPWLEDEAVSTRVGTETLWRLWSQLGLVNAKLGLVWDAVRAYEAAIALLEATISAAQCKSAPGACSIGSAEADLVALRVRYAHDLRASGLFRGSLSQLSAALWTRPSSAEAWHARGLALHAMGRHRAAVQTLMLGIHVTGTRAMVGMRASSLAALRRSSQGGTARLNVDDVTSGVPEWLYTEEDADTERGIVAHSKLQDDLAVEQRGCAFLLATTYHSLGQYGSALRLYNELFSEGGSATAAGATQTSHGSLHEVGSEHLGFCQRDWMLATNRWLSYPRRSVSLDAWTEPVVKESFAKRAGRSAVVAGYPMLHQEAEGAAKDAACREPRQLDVSPPAKAIAPSITLTSLPKAVPGTDLPRCMLPLLPVTGEEIMRSMRSADLSPGLMQRGLSEMAARDGVELSPMAAGAAAAADARIAAMSATSALSEAESEAAAQAAKQAKEGAILAYEATQSALPAELVQLADTADRVGAMMQYGEAAFVASWRQHRQCGLAAIELAQLCRKHWSALADGIEAGDEVVEDRSVLLPDSGCSKPSAAYEALQTLCLHHFRVKAAETSQGCGPIPLKVQDSAADDASDLLDMVDVGVQSASALSDDGVFAIMSKGAAASITTGSGTESVDWQLCGAAAPASAQLAAARTRQVLAEQQGLVSVPAAGSASAAAAASAKSGKASGRRKAGAGGKPKPSNKGRGRAKGEGRKPSAAATAAAPAASYAAPALAHAARWGNGAVAASAEASEAGAHWPSGYHGMCWRDVFDVSVQWRQLSEAFDPVFWLDQLTPQAFAEGFGLQTPLLQGQCRNPRYFSYFQRALELTKQLLLQQEMHSDEERARIGAAQSIRDLANATADRDFFVVSSCYSHARPPEHPRHALPAMRAGRRGRVMEGTRLTALSPGMPAEAAAAMAAGCRARQRAVGRALELLPGGPGPMTAAQRDAVDASSRLVQDFGDAGDVATGDGSDLGNPGPAPRGEVRPVPATFDDALDVLEAASPAAAPATTTNPARALQQRVAKDFTIRTPSTPQRWAAFEEELGLLWLQLSRSMAARIASSRVADASARRAALALAPDALLVASTILRIFYFWANMGALTRGSAACALSTLVGLCAAAGLSPALPLRGPWVRVQLDWEAILTEDVEVFVLRMGPPLFPGLAWAPLADGEQHPLSGSPRWKVPVPEPAAASVEPLRPPAALSGKAESEGTPPWLRFDPDCPLSVDDADSPWLGRSLLVPASANALAAGFPDSCASLLIEMVPAVSATVATVRDALVLLGVPNKAERVSVGVDPQPELLSRALCASFAPARWLDFTAAFFVDGSKSRCAAQPDEALDLARHGHAPGSLPQGEYQAVQDAKLMDAPEDDEESSTAVAGESVFGLEALRELRRLRLVTRAKVLGRLPVEATRERVLEALAGPEDRSEPQLAAAADQSQVREETEDSTTVQARPASQSSSAGLVGRSMIDVELD